MLQLSIILLKSLLLLYKIIASVKQYHLAGNHLHYNPQVKISRRTEYPMKQSYYIKVNGDFPTLIHTMPDTREKWQQQTCKNNSSKRHSGIKALRALLT